MNDVPKNQFAPVANLPTYKALAEGLALGDYHLLIATEVMKEPARWNEFWLDQPWGPNRFLIVDNGLIETGVPTDIDTLVKATQVVKGSCLVLPDKLRDYKGTMKLVKERMPEFMDTGIPLMGVVQGITVEEVTNIIDYYISAGVSYLSIPRVMTDVFSTRRWLVEKARWHAPVHLLGFSDNIEDDMTCAAMPGVMGIDSATPIWLGLEPYLYYLPTRPPRKADFPKRPKEFWTQEPNPKRSDIDIVLANIRKVRNWIEASVPAAQSAG